MPARPTPALDLILNLADSAANGRLSLVGSRVVSSPSAIASPARTRIVRTDTGQCRVCACVPTASPASDRAFDYVDLSAYVVRVALGQPGEQPYCLATLDTPLPSAAAVIATQQSVTADLPATKRITLYPSPYAGTFLLTLDDNDPIELPFNVLADQILANTPALQYSIRRVASNAWEISGTEPGQDVTIAADVTGLLVPKGVTGTIALNTDGLAAAFAAAATGTPPAQPRWLRVTLEVDIDGDKYQFENYEIAREILNLSTLVPTPIPPSDYASLSALIDAKQPLNSQLSALALLSTTPAGRSLLTKPDQAAILSYLSGQPLNSQLSAIASLATRAYGRGLLIQSDKAGLREYAEITFDNLPDKPTSIGGYGITDFDSLGDARWVQLENLATLGDPRWVQLANLNTLGDARWLQQSNVNSVGDARWVQLANYNALGDARWILDSAGVHKTGDETLAGIKTFSSAPVVPADSFAQSTVIGLVTDLAAKAPLVSPPLTGVPTAPTALAAVNNTQIATTGFVHTVIDNLVNGAEAALDTLAELAAQMRADESGVAALTTTVAGKLTKSANLGDLTDIAAARVNLSLATAALTDAANVFVPLQTFNSLATGNITALQLASAAMPTAVAIGDDEGATWSYKIVAKLADGTPSAASPAGSTTHGDLTLDATNKISLTWPAVAGAASYDVYRVASGGSPATLGKIANVTTNSYVDTGAVGDGSTAPAVNATGNLNVMGSMTLGGDLDADGNLNLAGNLVADGNLSASGNLTLGGNLTAQNIAADGTERLFFYEPGGDLDHARFNEPIKIDLSNPANNFKQGINITVITTNTDAPIRTSGIVVYAYTPTDSGGDCSAIFAQNSGGGNAISAFNFGDNRPSGYPNYPSNGYAIEASVDYAKNAIIAKSVDGISVLAMNRGGGGSFLAKTFEDIDLGRRAYSSQLADGSENFYVTYAGELFTRGDSIFIGDVQVNGLLSGADLTLLVTANPIIRLNTTGGNAAARNWSISANDAAWGDFTIRQSAGLGGDPAAGTPRLTISPTGDVAIGGALTGATNLPALAAANTFTAGQTIAGAFQYPLILRGTAASSFTGMQLRNDQNSAARALEIGYTGSAYSAGELGYIQTAGAYPLVLNCAGALTAGLRLFPSHGAYLGSSGPADPGDGVLSVNQVRFRGRTAPGSPAAGEVYFSSADSHFYGYNGSTWKQLDN